MKDDGDNSLKKLEIKEKFEAQNIWSFVIFIVKENLKL